MNWGRYKQAGYMRIEFIGKISDNVKTMSAGLRIINLNKDIFDIHNRAPVILDVFIIHFASEKLFDSCQKFLTYRSCGINLKTGTSSS
jgi:hypothetical protein